MKYPRSVIFVSFYIQFVMQSFYFSACKIIVHIFGLVSKKSLIYQKIHLKFFQELVFLNNHIFFSQHYDFKVYDGNRNFFSGLFEFHISFPFICEFKLLVIQLCLKYLSFGENDNLNITLDNIKFLSR